jgi:hypothetical protein
LPLNAPPPWRPMPPYESTMILRPVSPQSPCGPPTTKRPVGLTWNLVFLSMSFFGQHLLDDELDDGLAELLVLHLLVVLRADDDRVDARTGTSSRTRG